jgi:amino acid transporter
VKRTLSLSAIVSVVFFNVAGGTYALEGVLAAGPGLALMLIVVTPLVWSAPVALVCAELGTTIPEEGGYYAWSKRALGPFGAYCQGWWAWLYTMVDIGIYPTMFCDYLAYFWPDVGEAGSYWLRRAVMLTMIWGFVLLNLRGAHTIGNFAKAFTFAVVVPFVILMLAGVYQGLTGGFLFSATTPVVAEGKTFQAAFAAAIPIALWNYLGWDSISTIAGEMDDPRRNYPKALLIAILLICTIYILPTIVSLLLVGTPLRVDGQTVEWDTGAWAVAGKLIAGNWLGTIISAIGMVSAVGLYSALVLVYSRVPFVMSQDGYLPNVLVQQNTFGAPSVSLVVSGALYSGIVLYFDDLDALAAADVTMYAGMMSLELVSFLALRWREPALARPFKVPGGWPIAVVLCLLPWSCIGAGAYFRVLELSVMEVLGKAAIIMGTPLLLYPFIEARRRTTNSMSVDDSH